MLTRKIMVLLHLKVLKPHACILSGENTYFGFTELRFIGNNQFVDKTKK